MIPTQLRIVLVTPETTLIDEPVEALRFPLLDGQIGILPGRAPLVGRLGYGELRITTGAGKRSYFVDGGFVQVKGEVVSLLTNRAQPASTLDVKQAEDDLQVAQQRNPRTEVEFAAKATELQRARRKLAMALHPPRPA
ncbi:MAG TPA: F0F1 ATP synthase subunit epsilon [Planctomycetaceae bacterium]|nr:F0F1 ATP synthase subunit epsilon [Planctomycetaceae bacterium]